jgi:hypothetical protein
MQMIVPEREKVDLEWESWTVGQLDSWTVGQIMKIFSVDRV